MSWIEGYMEIDTTKTPIEGRGIFVVAKNSCEAEARLQGLHKTLKFAQSLLFICQRRATIIYVHRKRVSTNRCPGFN